jgi:hypothetical protein
MGLIRGVARTAVIAGTATAVSNNVSRRQQARWARQEQEAYPQQGYAYPPPQAYPPAQPAGSGSDDLSAQLDQLVAMRDRGQLTDAEFAAAKAKLLGM